MLGQIRSSFGLVDGRRGHDRVQPRQRHPATWSGCGRAASTASPSGCSRACPRAEGPRPHPRPGAGAPRRRVGAAGGLRAGQPRPDLRHAGGVARRLGGLAGRGSFLSARPRLGVRADRRGRHRAGAAGAARGGGHARRRRAGRQVRHGRRGARRGRARVVRAVQLGARRGRPLPSQPALLARRRLVGRRPGGALPRRWGALVERAAPRGVRRAAGGRGEPGPGA